MESVQKPGQSGNNLTLYQFFTPSYGLMQMATLEIQDLLDKVPLGAHLHLVLSQVTPTHYIGTLTLFSRWGTTHVRSSESLPEEALSILCQELSVRIREQRSQDSAQENLSKPTDLQMPLWGQMATG